MIPFAVATLGAVLMALAFPKTNAAVLAPVGAAGLFWSWFGLSPKRAFWNGWLAGTVFFAMTYSWFGETAGALIAPFGFFLALGPALGDAFFGFALVAALVAFAAQALTRRDRVARALVPLGAAAIFAAGEWLRSEGLGEIGVPFASLGLTEVTSPMAPVAAFAGSYGITFLLCVLGAYAAYALRMRPVRGSGVDAGLALLGVVACVALAWTFWPARAIAAPFLRVAAIQGAIPQSIKFTSAAFAQALDVYSSLTLRAAVEDHPVFTLWPETVIPTALNQSPALQARFSALARRARTELVVGTLLNENGADYNALYFFRPDGGLDEIYRKRQLVPFAEHLPFAPLLSWIPWTREISSFHSGSGDGIAPVDGLRVAPIICWESAFSALAVSDVRAGATLLAIATDDAWFGTTAGPYQHAQIAQMRALETGRWIVRAASTGISGIIAPNGRYTLRSGLGERTVVTGEVGLPVDTAYDVLGGGFIAALLALAYVATTAWGRRPRA